MLRVIKSIRGVRRLPVESFIFRRNYYRDETYEYDPLDKPRRDVWRRKPFAEEPKPDLPNFAIIKFDEVFDASNCNDIHDVKEGGFVPVSQTELDRYLPEGLAGEMDEEFDLTQRTSWMIRDSSKLLCRIIEEFENKGKRARGETDFTPNRQGLATPVILPGLTDRTEWPDATLKAFYYGAEINPGFRTKIYDENTSAYPEVSAVSSGQAVHKISAATPASGSMYTVRGEGSKVEEFIKTLQADGKTIPDKIMLTGLRGVGKSCTLNQAVIHARRRGWICLFVPEGWEHIWGGDYIQPVTINDPPDPRSEEELLAVQKIEDDFELPYNENFLYYKSTLEGDLPLPDGTLYDNPQQSALTLRGFWQAHHKVLKTIPLQHPEQLNKYDPMLQSFSDAWVRVKSLAGRERMQFMEVRAIIEEDDGDEELDELDEVVLDTFDYTPDFRPKNLEEFVRMGVAFRDLAGSIFIDIVQELKDLDLPDHPVMLAVDEYNYWEAPSSFSYRRRPILGKEICVPNSLNFLGSKKSTGENFTLKNGLCVGATSFRYPCKNVPTFEDTKSSVPLTIRVPAYSQVEIASVVSHYQKTNVVGKGMKTEDIVAYRMQSGSIGRLARLETISFFFPLSVRKHTATEEEMLFGSAEYPEGYSSPPMPGRSVSTVDDDDDSYDAPKPKKNFSKPKFIPDDD